MINTLVVDDEPLALELVKSYVLQTPELNLVGSCNNAGQAFEIISQGGVDLAFMDIQMPGMTGLTLAKTFHKDFPTKIIFTTAYSEFAIEGYKLNAVDYLLKPFDLEEFQRASAKAVKTIEMERKAERVIFDETEGKDTVGQSGKYFFVKSEYKLVRVEMSDLIDVEGLKDYVKLYVANMAKPILTLSTLKQMESWLPEPGFLRIHRSFIVNVNKITGIERGSVVMDGTQRLPVGEGYKQRFVEVIEKKTL